MVCVTPFTPSNCRARAIELRGGHPEGGPYVPRNKLLDLMVIFWNDRYRVRKTSIRCSSLPPEQQLIARDVRTRLYRVRYSLSRPLPLHRSCPLSLPHLPPRKSSRCCLSANILTVLVVLQGWRKKRAYFTAGGRSGRRLLARQTTKFFLSTNSSVTFSCSVTYSIVEDRCKTIFSSILVGREKRDCKYKIEQAPEQSGDAQKFFVHPIFPHESIYIRGCWEQLAIKIST